MTNILNKTNCIDQRVGKRNPVPLTSWTGASRQVDELSAQHMMGEGVFSGYNLQMWFMIQHPKQWIISLKFADTWQ